MKVVFFTGAGISRESGLLTFRDQDGLWAGHSVQDVCSANAWKQQPEKVLDFYNQRRREVLVAEPNAAHWAIADFEGDGHDVTVITQNIDDLHERAGSKNVIHLHGEIFKSRGVRSPNELLDCPGDIAIGDLDESGDQIRPHVVFFGESVPEYVRALDISRDADILVVVGSSLSVYPAASIVERTRAPRIFVVDPNTPDVRPLRQPGRVFTIVISAASLGVPEAVQQIRDASDAWVKETCFSGSTVGGEKL